MDKIIKITPSKTFNHSFIFSYKIHLNEIFLQNIHSKSIKGIKIKGNLTNFTVKELGGYFQDIAFQRIRKWLKS